MRLPLTSYLDTTYGCTMVTDADHRIVFQGKDKSDRKFALALVRKMNSHTAWRLFGMQPYMYTREDWLWDKGTNAKTP